MGGESGGPDQAGASCETVGAEREGGVLALTSGDFNGLLCEQKGGGNTYTQRHSLASLEGLSGCTALQTLSFMQTHQTLCFGPCCRRSR